MSRLAGIVAALLIGALAPGVAEGAKPRCGGGETVFLDGQLRIFGVHYQDSDESGWFEFACRGGRGRPLEVGGVGADTGVGSNDTPAYALGGSRYVGAYNVSDSEGGPDAYFDVLDLRSRRTVAYLNAVCCGGVPPFRVAPDGTLVVGGGSVTVVRPHRRPRVISDEGRDVALAGGTVYWTEGSAAGSATLSGVAGSAEGRMLEPVGVHRRRGPCISARGTTVAASPHVRVVRKGSGWRFACRDRSARRIPLGEVTPRIVGDRWLLAGPRVIDSRSGKVVARATGAVTRATVLRDGTLAWLEGARLRAAAPGGAPVELSAAASALAAGRRTIYWTEAGAPRSASASASALRERDQPGRSYAPVSAARSRSNPG